jgi:hypothetical protein
MNLRYSQKFVSSLRKLAAADKTTVILTVELFQETPSIHRYATMPLRAR